MIELRTLGRLRLTTSDGQDVSSSVIRPKRLALLAYLAAARPVGLHRRDSILGVFWPELDQTRARHSLSQGLHTIRRALGDGVIVTRGVDEVGIDRARLWCDAPVFDEAFELGELEEALDLYRGDLLEGVFVSDAPGFEQWLENERARLRQGAAIAARTLADRCGREGRVTSATRWAARAAELDPLDERSLRRLMRARDRAGDRAGALLAYQGFAHRLRDELEVEPSPETRSLADEIRDRDELGATSTQEQVIVGRPATPHRLPDAVATIPVFVAQRPSPPANEFAFRASVPITRPRDASAAGPGPALRRRTLPVGVIIAGVIALAALLLTFAL